MTEERKFPIRESAKLTKIRDLSSDTKGPVKVMGLVVESSPGSALVQDIYDEVENAKSILINVEGALEPTHKYILIGEVTEKATPDGMELRLAVSLAHDINTFEIKLYKESLELEKEIGRALSR